MENKSHGDVSNSPKKKEKGWLVASIICFIPTVADIALLIYCACAEVPFVGTGLENNMRMSDVELFISFGAEIVIFMAIAHFCLKRYEKANTELCNVLKIYYYISLPFYYLAFGIFLLIYYVIKLLVYLGKKSMEFLEYASYSSSGNMVTVKSEDGKKYELTYDSTVGCKKYYKDEKGNKWETDDGKKFTQSK